MSHQSAHSLISRMLKMVSRPRRSTLLSWKIWTKKWYQVNIESNIISDYLRYLPLSSFSRILLYLEEYLVEALTAVSLIARNWRGYVARQNFDALTGNSNGAIRRQQSAKKRFEELYAKFDDSTPEHLIRLFIEEVSDFTFLLL